VGASRCVKTSGIIKEKGNGESRGNFMEGGWERLEKRGGGLVSKEGFPREGFIE